MKSLWILILFIFSVSTLGFAGGRAPILSKDGPGSGLDRLFGYVVPYENMNYGHTDFLLPNELETFRLKTLVEGQKEGVLLTVGTFRGLFLALFGNFSQIIMLDNNRTVTEFNRLNLNLIKSLGDVDLDIELQRYVYVAIMSGKWVPIEKFEEIKNSSENNLTKFRHVLSEVRNAPTIRESTLPSKMERMIEKFQETVLFVKSNEAFRSLFVALFSDSEKNKPILVNERKFEMTYWSSNEKWDRVQNWIRENKISLVTASLAGLHGMKEIEKILKLPHVRNSISVLDISNCMDLMLFSSFSQFVANIRSLPFTSDGKVIFTRLFEKPVHQDPWLYLSISSQTFLKRADLGSIKLLLESGLQHLDSNDPYVDLDQLNIIH